MSDKKLPDFWRAIKPEDIITLTDIRTLEASTKQAQGLSGLDYRVTAVERLQEFKKLAEWRIFGLECSYDKRDISVIVKIVDQDLDIGVLEPLGIDGGTREELLEREMHFLFEPPEDEDNFRPLELSYTAMLPNEDTGFCWYRKPQGELLAKIASIPEKPGTDEITATIVEYGGRLWKNEKGEMVEKEEIEEPDQIYIIERGGDKNSFVEFFGVWSIGPADIEVLRK